MISFQAGRVFLIFCGEKNMAGKENRVMSGKNSKDSRQRSGSQNSSRKYGVIRQNNEAYMVRRMGVSDRDVIGVDRLNALLNRMTAGDVLCVPTVLSFASSAYDLFCKMQFLSNRGVEFQSGNEYYLNFSSVKPLSVVAVETLKVFASREVDFVKWVQYSKLSDEAKVPLINRIQAESLADIALVFANNGIKKRGS